MTPEMLVGDGHAAAARRHAAPAGGPGGTSPRRRRVGRPARRRGPRGDAGSASDDASASNDASRHTQRADAARARWTRARSSSARRCRRADHPALADGEDRCTRCTRTRCGGDACRGAVGVLNGDQHQLSHHAHQQWQQHAGYARAVRARARCANARAAAPPAAALRPEQLVTAYTARGYEGEEGSSGGNRLRCAAHAAAAKPAGETAAKTREGHGGHHGTYQKNSGGTARTGPATAYVAEAEFGGLAACTTSSDGDADETLLGV